MNRIIEYLIIGRKLNKTYNRYLGEVSEIYGLNRMEINVLLFLYNNLRDKCRYLKSLILTQDHL